VLPDIFCTNEILLTMGTDLLMVVFCNMTLIFSENRNCANSVTLKNFQELSDEPVRVKSWN
jgi:hypothetical protein